MSDETKAAVQLLVECAVELQRLDDGKLEWLKDKLRRYFEDLGMRDTRSSVYTLCDLLGERA